MARKIIISIDDSECALGAAKWTLNTVVREGDEVHLVAAMTLITAGLTPTAPLATAGAVAALTAQYQQQLKDEERRVKGLLHHAAEKVLQRPECKLHCLPAAGGASGVGESIVAWAKRENADLVVVGSRGMGGAKSTLMSLVGLGSVSSYLLHHLHSPVAVVHGSHLEAEPKERRKVMVAVDDSELAQQAQQWAIENLLRPLDELHLVSVALPVPYVIAADDAAAAHVLEEEEIKAASTSNREFAEYAVEMAVKSAVAAKVDDKRVFVKVLEPEGGASDVGLSIKHYAEANNVDVVVVGSRGMGAMKRALMSMVGLGSVSDWCAHNMGCPVIVAKRNGGARAPTTVERV